MNRISTEKAAELASAIIEEDFNNRWLIHTVENENGDLRYVEEAQDNFNRTLEIIESVLEVINE